MGYNTFTTTKANLGDKDFCTGAIIDVSTNSEETRAIISEGVVSSDKYTITAMVSFQQPRVMSRIWRCTYTRVSGFLKLEQGGRDPSPQIEPEAQGDGHPGGGHPGEYPGAD